MSLPCTIARCNADATVLAVLDRPATPAAHTDRAWTGHLETPYCAEHAIDRPDATGILKYGDTWTLTPINTNGNDHG